MARKMTPLQREYNREFKKIQKRIEKLESQGFIFDQSKLPKFRKTASTKGIQHLRKHTEKYLKNMPSTRFMISPTIITSGKRGEEIVASARARKGAATRRRREKIRGKRQVEKAKQSLTKSLLDTKYKGDERFEDTSYRENEPDYSGEEARKEDALAEAINTGVSNEFFAVFPNGDVVDAETGEIVYEQATKEIKQEYQTDYAVKGYGESLVDGLDALISDYEQSDNRWVREKASALRDSFESADRETLADNLGYMSSDFISYVQQVIEESGGNQNEVNNNYAKIVEIQALIEGRTLEMGSLRNSFAD